MNIGGSTLQHIKMAIMKIYFAQRMVIERERESLRDNKGNTTYRENKKK